jgi:hypothetical protein
MDVGPDRSSNCREYEVQRSERVSAREMFRVQYRRQMPATRGIAYPPELRGPFPKFTEWLSLHIHRLRGRTSQSYGGGEPVGWARFGGMELSFHVGVRGALQVR